MWNENVKVGQKFKGVTLHEAETHLINKIVNGYAPIVMVVGEVRKGKSWFALSLAHRMHNTFNVLKGDFDVEQHVYYDAARFTERLNDQYTHFKETGEKGRETFFLDEAGVNLSSKTWYSDLNRAVDKAIQTQAKLNNLYIFVLPDGDDLEKGVRKRINLVMEMRNRGIAKCWKMKNYPAGFITGKPSRKPIRFPDYYLPKPPDEVVADFEKQEDKFKSAVNKDEEEEEEEDILVL